MKWKLPLALGTDSLASNQDLNLFAEMRSCVDIYRLSPVAVFDFATRNGARLLQRAKDFGIIDRGYLAKWISVPLEIAQNSIPPKTRNINIKHLSIFFTNLLEIPVHPVEEVFY
jgi:cytosine/adenosine deaminase-related metal-dependent hydrolase